MSVARRLGRYTLRERIGRGGFSEVFLAETEGAGGFRKRVVIKRLRKTLDDAPALHDKLAAEARLVTRLGHGNVVQVLDFGIDDDAPYIVMELVDGASLAELLTDLERRGDRLGVEEALFVVESVCAALEYAHTARTEEGEPLQVIHRDVKPGNVLLSRDGVVKLSDFGIAFARADAVFDVDEGLGTEGYAPPEQLRGDPVGPTADVYATGILLGKLVAAYVASAQPGSEALWDVVDRATAEDPTERFPSAAAMLSTLQAWRAERELQHRPGELPALVQRLDEGRAHARLELPEDVSVEAPETRIMDAPVPPPAASSRWPLIVVIGLALVAIAGVSLVVTQRGALAEATPVTTKQLSGGTPGDAPPTPPAQVAEATAGDAPLAASRITTTMF